MLAHFYIEVQNKQDWIKMERLLNAHGYGFYDVNDDPPEQTLEEIEARLEDK